MLTRHSQARPSHDATPSAWGESAAFCVAALVGSILFWLLIQRRSYASLWSPEQTLEEAELISLTVCAQTWLFLLPGLLASVLLCTWRRPRLASYGFVVWSSLALSFEALDLQTYAAFGRHLWQIARFAFLPGAAQASGDAGHWMLVALRVLVLSVLGSALASLVVRRALRPLARRSSPFLRRFMTVLAVPVFGLGAAEPWFAGVFFRHPDLRERLYRQLVWSPPDPEFTHAELKDPNWAALDSGLRAAYARAFPQLFSLQRLTIDPGPARDRPNVLIILVESWRADSLRPERMPRLAAWAEHGLVAQQHYGGSDYSEAGMFSLLYGRSPLVFHATLDAREPAAWCPTAHQLGLECSYFSGHPKIWMRREEFLNPSAVDHFVHDDAGSWNQWDRTALTQAVRALQAPGAHAQIALSYLMSTHFEYEYPAAYERHLPVRHDMSWRDTETAGLGPDDRIPVSNRYLNSLAFVDDLVADAIAQLDPQRTIVVLTGDHGESLGEDGHFGHGYGFPDSIARVPFVIVGPGVAPSHRSAP
ncbi:MAG TPA: sulfatase-like hydrolase/transferase, partial [Polyangiaceae bacterium]